MRIVKVRLLGYLWSPAAGSQPKPTPISAALRVVRRFVPLNWKPLG